jgi:iron complex transport system substrate-binding protein
MKHEGMKDEGRRMRRPRHELFIHHPSSFIFILRLASCILLLSCGRPARPPAAPSARSQRIVSLAPNVTEMVYALGAGDRIAGTDDYSDTPPAAKVKPKVGGVTPNLERILALHPDLVLVASSNAGPHLLSALQRVHLPFEVIRTDRVADVPVALETIGRRLGLDNAEAARAALDVALAGQRRTRSKRLRVLFVAYTQPLYVAGRKTFAGDILELCGADNAALVDGWPQYSMEALLANPPDVVLHPDRSVRHDQVVALFANSPKKPEVVAVDENVFSRPGPRIVEAAKRLNAILDAHTR